MNILVCSICFFLALPATIAIFPQMSDVCHLKHTFLTIFTYLFFVFLKVPTRDLEPEIAKSTNDSVVYYNKGL